MPRRLIGLLSHSDCAECSQKARRADLLLCQLCGNHGAGRELLPLYYSTFTKLPSRRRQLYKSQSAFEMLSIKLLYLTPRITTLQPHIMMHSSSHCRVQVISPPHTHLAPASAGPQLCSRLAPTADCVSSSPEIRLVSANNSVKALISNP